MKLYIKCILPGGCVDGRMVQKSCGLTFVVFEETSKPFATPKWAYLFRVPADSRKEQDIPFPLMISLVVIMFYVLIKRPRQGSLSKQDHTRETLLLDGSAPPLRVGIQVGRAGWEDHPLDTSIIDDLLKDSTELGITVMDEILTG